MTVGWEGFLWHEVNKEAALAKSEVKFSTEYEAEVKIWEYICLEWRLEDSLVFRRVKCHC